LLGIVHPADRTRLADTIEAVVRECGTYDLRFRIVLKGGVTRQIHSVSYAVCNPAGTPIEVIGTVQDETEPAQETGTPVSAGLSRREEEVLRACAWGYANHEIGAHLGISVRTIEVHKTRAMRKTHLRRRLDIVRYALDHGWFRAR
jgi:DNA-binding NarL/FixJ family response regulator